MAYTVRNFRTKKEFLAAFARGEKLEVFQPGPFGPDVRDGVVAIEGPHYPEPHRWYVAVEVRDGVVTRIVRR